MSPTLRPLSLRRGAGADRWLAGRIGSVEVVAGLTGIGPSVAIGDLIVPERVVDVQSGAVHRPAHLGDVTPRGILCTSDGLLDDQAAIARLREQGAIAIDMETAAVAAVCERRGCPWSVLRAISDRADDGSTDAAVFALAGPDGSGDLPAVARFLLTRPWRIPQLVRLARGTRIATERAASAAARALSSLPADAPGGGP